MLCRDGIIPIETKLNGFLTTLLSHEAVQFTNIFK